MKRSAFPGACALSMAACALALVGCGGGGGAAGPISVATGGSGSLSAVRLGPPPGTAFVGQDVTFQMGWTASAPPPASVEVSLNRYQEARGGSERLIAAKGLKAAPAAGVLTWNLLPDSELTAGGVYFLELTSGGTGVQRSCYLVESGRAATTRAQTINTGTSAGALSGVQFSPSAGSVYIPRASPLQIVWPAGSVPPPTLEVRLWRVKEARGHLARDVSEQELSDPVRSGNSFTWTLRRRDGSDLDPGGVYYLELRAPGETDVRSAYIVSAEM